MCAPYVKYIDIRTSDIRMGEIVDVISRLQREHPDQEIFMDGDERAVIGRMRA